MVMVDIYRGVRAPASPPLPTFRRDSPGNLIARCIIAHARASINRNVTPTEIAAEYWPMDTGLEFVLRAASAPAQIGVVGWAAELGQRIVADSLAVLYPASASAALFQLAPSVTFGREASIGVPGFGVSTIGKTAVFVAERQPIPVFQPVTTGAVLLPYKVAGIMVATREMIESSNAEALITDLVKQSIGRALDEVLVDSNPATASRPAGLRNGVSATTPVATASDAWGNFLGDIGKLADAVSPVAGNAPIAFVGSAGRALKARVLLGDVLNEGVNVFGSNAVINDFLCIATAALVSAIGVPEVEVSKVSTLTMDDAPAPDPTTPPGPNRSLWQTDSIGIKIRWPVSWVIRDPRGFAWMTPTGW
jgi:hypothetical protein